MNTNIPFRAAIFDLDGTLLDSLGVWHEVDRRFFESLNMPQPEDYARAMQGLSFLECAEYTIERFSLDMTPAALMAEWMRITARAYAEDVGMVPGARDYLRMLKRAGVKLAVATANRRSVVEPCLDRLGVLSLFDAVCTTEDVGDRGKGDGALFRYAASRIHADCAACAVFEDTREGLVGARAAGMMAYAVLSEGGYLDEADALSIADGAVRDFFEMVRCHAFPDNRRRCVIFTAHCEGDPKRAYTPQAGDLVVCADRGYRIATDMGVAPDLVIGDFDSADMPHDLPVVRHPVEKDDTDAMLCVRYGLSQGLDDFVLVGGFGGRLDHTLANLQTLHYLVRRGAKCEMCDGETYATVVADGTITLPRRPGKLGLFALDGACHGVSIRGAKYSGDDYTLTGAFPLGAGNDFKDDEVTVSVKQGTVTVIVCPE